MIQTPSFSFTAIDELTMKERDTTMTIPEDIKDGIDKALPSLEFNPDDYREELENIDVSEEQAQEFLATLWNIMAAMVDIGWGVNSVQILLPDIFEKAGQDSVNLIEQKDSTTSPKNAAQRGRKEGSS